MAYFFPFETISHFKRVLHRMMPLSTSKTRIPLAKLCHQLKYIPSDLTIFQKRKAEFPLSQIQSIFLLWSAPQADPSRDHLIYNFSLKKLYLDRM